MNNRMENVPTGTLTLIDRRTLTVDGVENVLSFDDRSVYLNTAPGDLVIEGAELHVNDLSIERGTVSISGRIDGVYYLFEKNKRKNGLFGKKTDVYR